MEKIFIPIYCDRNSILLINSNGALRKLYCPFRVKVIKPVSDIRTGIYVWVEEVASNEKDELIYLVLGKLIRHNYFEIMVTF